MNSEGLSEAQCQAYLSYVHLSASDRSPLPPPTLATLFSVHRQTLFHIPFSTLNLHVSLDDFPSDRTQAVHARRGPGIVPTAAACFENLARGQAGGYCFEGNVLLAALLRGLGFGVELKLARSNFAARGKKPSATPDWSALVHTVCLVSLGPATTGNLERDEGDEGQVWVCDVAFGGGGLFEPLPLPALNHNGFISHVNAHDGVTTFSIARGPLPSHDHAVASAPPSLSTEDERKRGVTLYKQGPGTLHQRLPIIHVELGLKATQKDLETQSFAVAHDAQVSYVARTLLCQNLVPDGGQQVLRMSPVESVAVEASAEPHGQNANDVSDLETTHANTATDTTAQTRDGKGGVRVEGEYYVNYPDGRRTHELKVATMGELRDVLEIKFAMRIRSRD